MEGRLLYFGGSNEKAGCKVCFCATYLSSWPGVLRQLRCVYKISPTLADTLTMKSHI